jgi:uncharacterized protein
MTMMRINNRAWNECEGHELDEIECWAILGRHTTARLAITQEEELDILPVRYVLDGRWIVVPIPPRLELDTISLGQLAFEVNEEVGDGQCSVVVRGSAFDITGGLDEASLRERRIGLASLGYKPDTRLIRIVPRIVRGRRMAA